MREQSSTTGPFALKAETSAGTDRLLSGAEAQQRISTCDGRCSASPVALRRRLFVLFFFSGFCGLVYQMVWVRLAFASFGIITPVLSVVISVFMLGLSWGPGRGGGSFAGLVRRTDVSAIFYYAGAEFVIGLGAFAVPKLFGIGKHFLLAAGQTITFQYLFLSAAALAAAILPWCVLHGGDFPADDGVRAGTGTGKPRKASATFIWPTCWERCSERSWRRWC